MIDANIIISAILFPESVLSKILKHIILNSEITLSQYTIDEVYKVFNKKFPHRVNEMKDFIDKLPYELFSLNEIKVKQYPNIRDIDDMPVLINAIESNVDILITGDKDFDEIKIRKPRIMNPRMYFEEYMDKIVKSKRQRDQ
ncbi:MAG: putative toxin-antitoxin system toxin component, PIN family [Spirochaetaceae bacterium]|nr:putative toxin-antitoxin system toxin component, PIN family [Spirochaetaceae bacterium]